MGFEQNIVTRPGLMLMVESHVEHRIFTGCPHSDRPGDAREQDLLCLGAIFMYGG